jgi:hypothetical protein
MIPGAHGFSHSPTFRNMYLDPALHGGWIERTQPGYPRRLIHRYRLADKGLSWVQKWLEE